MVVLSCSFLCHSIRCVLYTRPILSQFIVIPFSLSSSPALCESREYYFFAAWIARHSFGIPFTTSRDRHARKLFLFIERQDECRKPVSFELWSGSSFGRDENIELEYRAQNRSHICFVCAIFCSSFTSHSQTHRGPGKINEVWNNGRLIRFDGKDDLHSLNNTQNDGRTAVSVASRLLNHCIHSRNRFGNFVYDYCPENSLICCVHGADLLFRCVHFTAMASHSRRCRRRHYHCRVVTVLLWQLSFVHSVGRMMHVPLIKADLRLT